MPPNASRSWALACAAWLVLACGERDAPLPVAPPTPPPVVAAPEPPPPPQPTPLPRGPCRVARTIPAPPIDAPLYQVQVAWDERGGLLVYRPLSRDVVAAVVSPDGEIATPAPVGFQAEHVAHVRRIRDRFAVILRVACASSTNGCMAVGVLDGNGHAVGEPLVVEELSEGFDLPPLVEAGAMYWAAPTRGDGFAVDRFDLDTSGVLSRHRLLELPALTRTDERIQPYNALALAVSGERWAFLVVERESPARLYVNGRDAPANVALPLARMSAVLDSIELHFVGDHLELAGRRWQRPDTDPPAWIMALAPDGRVLELPTELMVGNAFAGDHVRVQISTPQHQLVRTDALARPLGDPLALPPAFVFGIAAGASADFLVIREVTVGHFDSQRIVCEPGTPPTPSPRVALESADPGNPCGAVACTVRAPTLAALERAVGHKCDSLAFDDGPPPADRDSARDVVSVVSTRQTGDETIPEVATLLCARGIENDFMARWSFVAARTESGWSACALDGMRADFFDFGLEIGEVRLEPWLEGDPPELVVPVTLDDSGSDGGEVSESRGEELHVCGLSSGALVCWGSIAMSSMSRDGAAEDEPEAIVHRNRIEPDGHGWVSITPIATPPLPAIRRDVTRLRPGCPDVLP